MRETAQALDERELTFRCERFVFEEAELLDRRLLDAWTGLFAEDGIYWLPLDEDQADVGGGLNIIFDDRPRLLDRVARLHTGLAFSDEPHSRTNHALGSVRLLPADDVAAVTGGVAVAPTECVVGARCVIGRTRAGQATTETLHARLTWILRPNEDSFAIVLKRVDLLNAHEPLPVLAFLL